MKDLALTEPGGDPLPGLFKIATVFAKGGMFPTHRDEAQCATKLIIGAEYGLSPLESMNGLHVIQGKIVLAAGTMASAIKRSGKYDYRSQSSEVECKITFFDVTGKEPRPIGTTVFTMDDAQRAGLRGDNWRKYPKAMLFARCISAGYKEHCPDALGAGPVYVEAQGESEIGGAIPTSEPASFPSTTGGANAAPPVVVVDHEPPPSPPAEGGRKPSLRGEMVPATAAIKVRKIERGEKERDSHGSLYARHQIVASNGTKFETLEDEVIERLEQALAEKETVDVEWLDAKYGDKYVRQIVAVNEHVKVELGEF